MKIAYVHDALWPWSKGGAEKRLYEMARRMAAKGHDVHIFGALQKDDRFYPILQNHKMTIHIVYQYGSLFSGERRSIWSALGFSWNLFWKLRKYKFDVIDCYQAPVIHVPFVWAAKGKSKFIVSWFEVWGDYWKEYAGPIAGRVGMFLEKAALRLADKVIVSSEQTKKDIASRAHISLNTHVVHNGIDWHHIQSLKPFRQKWDIVDVCRLIKGKRVDLFIKAAAKWKLKALVIGDGPERRTLEKLARRLKADVTFLGRVESDDDVIRYIKSAKIFVHLSQQEGGSSMTLFEANACGLPVVALNDSLGIDKSLLVHGKNGFFADLRKPYDYNHYIMFSHALSSLMKKDCIAFSKRFDWKTVFKSYKAVLKCR